MNARIYDEHTLPRPLPVGLAARRSSGWWGMLALIATEASLFAYLIFAYFYLQSQHAQNWPPSGLPPLRYSIPTTVALLVSVGTMWWAEYSVRTARRAMLLAALLITMLLGVAYVVLQFLDWQIEPFLVNADAYSSLFYSLTALHVLHAIVGIFILIGMFMWTLMGYITPRRYSAISVAAMYWYFLVLVWVAIFITLYMLPYIGPG
ncbi:MAG TPA: cytochrome c oxidase subunit 3 [Rhodanobacteraceae bacterium]